MADEDDDKDTGTDDTGTDDKDEDEEDEYTPPSAEEWKRVQAALSKANAEAKQRRIELRKQREEEARKAASGDDAAKSLEAERAKWQAETDTEIIRERAATALAAAGLHVPDGKTPEDVVRRAVRLLDLGAVTRDKNGKVEGLSEAIEELREEMPNLFGKRGAASGASRGVGSASGGAGRGQSNEKPKSASQKLAEVWKGTR